MKIAILVGAALLGATGFAAAPADAQRHGWNDRHDGYRNYRGYDRRDRHWRGDRRWNGNRGHRWDRGRRWGGGRTVCHWERGYYGRQRVCYRVR